MNGERSQSGTGGEKARIKREASEWVARMDRGLTAAEQDAFFDWLERDARHREALNHRQAAWNKLKGLAAWRPQHSEEVNPDLLKAEAGKWKRSWRGASLWGLAVAAVVALAALAWWWGSDFLNTDDGTLLLTAQEGEALYRRHTLADGSVIELNEGARVSVHYSSRERVVNLHSGEAFFEVAKDAGRPFTVIAAGAVVKAVGTAFNVSLGDEEVEVLVTEGQVEIRSVSEPRLSLDESAAKVVSSLSAGQLSRVRLAGASPVDLAVREISRMELEERLAWKRLPVMQFVDTPLRELVGKFNLYNETKIVVEDPDLEGLVVSAALRPDNIDGLARLLELSLDVEVERGDGELRIRKGR